MTCPMGLAYANGCVCALCPAVACVTRRAALTARPGHRVSRPRGTGSVGDSVGEGAIGREDGDTAALTEDGDTAAPTCAACRPVPII